MAVVVQYIVERDGVQKMTFASKKEADAYDRMLDISDELFTLLGEGELGLDEAKLEEVALFLAKNSDRAAALLKGVKPKASGKAPTASPAREGEEVAQEAPAEAPPRGRRKAA